MLLQFSVENFQSFKNRAIMSLVPSKDKDHIENIISKGNYKGLNSVVTYGANASGKTSFYKAMTFAIIMIRNSNNRQVNEVLPVVPFKFDERSSISPSKFEFQFVGSDGYKYIYGFSATSKQIDEEYLYKFTSRKPTKIFERKNDKYEFTAREAGALEPLVAWNTPNKLFLSTATMWNAQSTKTAYEWFVDSIDTFTDLTTLSNAALENYQGDNKDEYVKFTEQLLQRADINIAKLSVKVKKVPIKPEMRPFISGIVINGQLIQPQEQTEVEVLATHKVKGTDNSIKECKLALAEESQGTQILFSFGPLVKNAFDNGRVLVIDEIDKSLHTFLVKQLINMFRNPEFNKNGAQLIVTSHDTSLLSLDTFRRDQVYFVEKNNENAESCIYSLDEYLVRKTENIEKGYLAGRYGAVPYLQAGDIL
ncbi:MAG: ATP-binding protein [Lachnospiraceae bacterium]|nr:ATP-binding protein [Lachnospiraceae bacterium]